MKRRTTLLVVTALIVVAVGILTANLIAAGTNTLRVPTVDIEQVPAEAKHKAPPASARNLAGAVIPIASHHTSGPLLVTWDRYEKIISDPDVWHLRVSYRLYDQDGNQIGYQSLVSGLRPGVDEPGSGSFMIDDVRPTWPDLEPGITHTVRFSATWSSAYHEDICAISTTQKIGSDGYYPFEVFQIQEWYEDCPDDPATSTPWPDQPTLTPRPTWETQPTLTPKPTPTCQWTATPTTGPPEPSPSPYPTEPPLPTPTPRPTATEYPPQP